MEIDLKAVDEGKKFRLQNTRIHLTYKSHIPPEAWLSWMTKVKEYKIKLYSIVHEKGNSLTPYDHTHILIDFGYTFQSRKVNVFDWKCLTTGENIHPNIKIVKTAAHWKNTLVYHYKESPPFTNIPKPDIVENPIKEIWKSNTLQDALLSTCSTLKNVGGVIAAFNCKPADYGIEPVVDWKPWQKELLDEIKNKPDSRHITWYYDPFGNAGKTFISKHLGQYKGAFVSTRANAYHVATSLDEFIKQNGNDSILVVIFNFSRQQENHKIYQALEELKDGMMTSEKYKGRTLYFNHPHLICLANYLPDINSMTKDRWDIRAIQNDVVVKRYLGGKVIFELPEIDHYVKHSLQEVDKAYSPEEYPQATAEMPSRPLNIKGTAGLASLEHAAAPPQPASRELASLAPAAQPQPKVEQRPSLPPLSNLNMPPTGRMIDNVFYPIPQRPQTPPFMKGFKY
jgi:hypothetical protein